MTNEERLAARVRQLERQQAQADANKAAVALVSFGFLIGLFIKGMSS